jgi:hypothetical protein
MNGMKLYIELFFILFLTINSGYLTGYIKSLKTARYTSWLLIVFFFILAEIMSREASPFMRMLFIITTSLFSLKSTVLVETYRGNMKLNYIQWLAFCTGWFGMRPQIFEKFRSSSLNDLQRLIIKGVTRIILGFVFLFASGFILKNYEVHYFLPGIVALIGFSFILHFGILNLSTAFWRSQGVDCKELFRSPAVSISLKEFWGKRWNLAFSEMTALVVYRPLKDKAGKDIAVLIAFLFSGILHEIAISLPVRTGYGLPLLYFCIHGMVMQMEDKVGFVKKIISNKILARIWVMCWLIVPMPLLFHKEFIIKIVFPLMNKIVSAVGLVS